jgi:hypothetical protein
VHLHTKSESPNFPNLKDKKNNIEEQRERSMKVAVQQENLQLLTKTLQELFLAEVPLGGVFQVKCAVNHDGLMILIQHPIGVTVDTQTVFQVIEDAIQSLPNQGEEHIQCFFRVLGEKRPYSQRSLYIHQRVEMDEINFYPTVEATTEATTQVESTDNSSAERLRFPPFSVPVASASDEVDSPFANYISTASASDEVDSPFANHTFTTSPSDEIDSSFANHTSTASVSDEIDSSFAPSNDEIEEEPFDPFAGTPDLITSKPAKPIKPMLFGAAFIGIVVLAGATYLFTTPCVLTECKALQTAEQLKTESRQLMRLAKSEAELVKVQQKLETSNLDLAKVPSWSPHYQKAAELQASLSGSSERIDQVVKALQAGSLAINKTKTPANTLEELQARQKLWRRAITPLETIGSNSEFYALAQVKLLSYRSGLKTVNQQLQAAEKWLKKLNDAKAVANVAAQQEITAKSLNELQKVQSTWQVAVNALNIIPKTSSAYSEAQQLLEEYKPKLAVARARATKEQLAAKTYQQAISTANQAKTSQQKQQWQTAVMQWEQALQSAKQVPNDSLQYFQAQSLIEPYSAALKQAQAKLESVTSLEQTRTDLNQVCTNGMRICTFNIENQRINVQLTPEYDRARQTSVTTNNPANNPETANMNTEGNQHLQILQQALAVISDNAQLSLAIYDSQARPVYTRSLE